MTKYLIEFEEVTNNTELGGNVDPDRYAFCIANAQDAVLRELLGDTLYQKIEDDYFAGSLSGNYETLYNNYIRPILINQTMVEFYAVGAYQVANGGVFKHSPANGNPVEKSDIDFLRKEKQAKVDMYVERCQRWLFRVMLPEYTWHYDNNVNPTPKGNVLSIGFINAKTPYNRLLPRTSLGLWEDNSKIN